MNKKIVYIDLDDTIADFTGHASFQGHAPNEFTVSAMYEPGFFLSLKPIDGALISVRAIMRLGFDVQILSQPVAESAHSYSEKIKWIGLHFPDLINKVNLSQDKGNFVGGYLIDDNEAKWKNKFEANGGKFISFNYKGNALEEWSKIVDFFILQRGKDFHAE